MNWSTSWVVYDSLIHGFSLIRIIVVIISNKLGLVFISMLHFRIMYFFFLILSSIELFNVETRGPVCRKLQQQQQQLLLSHLSQVLGGRLHEPKENYAASGTWISFLHSFLSSNMTSLRPLAFVSFRITFIYVLFGLPCALLTCFKVIRSTRRTDASVSLRRTWQTIVGDFLSSSLL